MEPDNPIDGAPLLARLIHTFSRRYIPVLFEHHHAGSPFELTLAPSPTHLNHQPAPGSTIILGRCSEKKDAGATTSGAEGCMYAAAAAVRTMQQQSAPEKLCRVTLCRGRSSPCGASDGPCHMSLYRLRLAALLEAAGDAGMPAPMRNVFSCRLPSKFPVYNDALCPDAWTSDMRPLWQTPSRSQTQSVALTAK